MIVTVQKSVAEVLEARLACIKEKSELLISHIDGINNGIVECCGPICILVVIDGTDLAGEYVLTFTENKEYYYEGTEIAIKITGDRYEIISVVDDGEGEAAVVDSAILSNESIFDFRNITEFTWNESVTITAIDCEPAV